jgi:hypothetical protein
MDFDVRFSVMPFFDSENHLSISECMNRFKRLPLYHRTRGLEKLYRVTGCSVEPNSVHSICLLRFAAKLFSVVW